MMSLYREIYDLTDGLVTPLIGQTLIDAGYDAGYSLIQKNKLNQPPSWADAITYNHPILDVHIPTMLDFGAAGKGYLVDLVSQLLRANSILSFCVDAGGDMFYQNESKKSLSVGLENPSDATQVIGIVPILNQSIAGSAGNRRTWGDFHHIIHPGTLVSPQHMLAVWVVAESTILADILTTALFFAKAEVLQKHFVFEYFILNPDYSFQKSDDFQVQFFPTS